MNSLDRFMELLLAIVFLCAGLAKVFSYNSAKKSGGASGTSGFTGLPYVWAALIGAFEIAAAMVLVAPAGTWPSDNLALPAAGALALLMAAASIYRQKRQQSSAPTIALFLMALFVIAARCL